MSNIVLLFNYKLILHVSFSFSDIYTLRNSVNLGWGCGSGCKLFVAKDMDIS